MFSEKAKHAITKAFNLLIITPYKENTRAREEGGSLAILASNSGLAISPNPLSAWGEGSSHCFHSFVNSIS